VIVTWVTEDCYTNYRGFLDRIGNNAPLGAIGWNLWKQWRRTTPFEEWTIPLLINCQLINKKGFWN